LLQKEKKILEKNFLGKICKNNLAKWHNLNEKKLKKID
jgi:hypothetical protein